MWIVADNVGDRRPSLIGRLPHIVYSVGGESRRRKNEERDSRMKTFRERFAEIERRGTPRARLAALEHLREECFEAYRDEAARELLGRNDLGPLPLAIARARRAMREGKIANDWLVEQTRVDSEPHRCLQDEGNMRYSDARFWNRDREVTSVPREKKIVERVVEQVKWIKI